MEMYIGKFLNKKQVNYFSGNGYILSSSLWVTKYQEIRGFAPGHLVEHSNQLLYYKFS